MTGPWRRLLPGPVVPVALDGDAVYALLYTIVGGHQGGPVRVARIDRLTGDVVLGALLPGGSGGVLSAGSLWVAGGLRDGEAPDGRLLYRLDPRSLAVQQQLELPDPAVEGRAVAAVAAAPAAVWAGLGHVLVRIDPTGGGVQTQTRTDRDVKSLSAAPGGDVLYAAEESDEALFVTKRHPATGALRVRSANLQAVPGGGARLSSISDGVWVSYPTGMLGTVVRLRASDLKQVAQIVPGPDSNIGSNAVAAFVVGEILWITDGAMVACADPNSGTTRHAEVLDGAGGLVADSAAVYVASSHGLVTMAPPPECAA